MQAVTARRSSPVFSPAIPGTRLNVRLGDLIPTSLNVRKTKRTAETVRAMAQSIHAHGGVMQNLLLVADFQDGKWTGKYGVAGGETRRLGCCHLRDGGIEGAAETFTDDFLLPGLIVDAPEASAISATENIQRTQLHPADEYEAFRELFDQCGSAEHVADFFAVSVATVERRLKLANASPRMFGLFRDGQMSLGQLMALCLVDDHARQEAAWAAGKSNPWMRNEGNLRQALTKGKVNVRDNRFARFVGMQAYEAAGGQVVRDMFSQHADDGYIEDGALLQRLAADKLKELAASVLAEGWTWVEVKPTFSHDEQARYGRCPVRRRNLNADQTKQQRALRERSEAARKAWRDAEDNDTDATEVSRLESVADECATLLSDFEDSTKFVDAAHRLIAGVVLSIDHAGTVEIHRGFVKPEDRKELKRLQKASERGPAAAAKSASAEPAEASDGLSRPFKLRLGAQRTAALQATVARNVPLALASLALSMVNDVFRVGRDTGTHRMSFTSIRERLGSVDPTIPTSRAFTDLGELVATWKARIPAEDTFGWLCALPLDELLQLVAVCTALTLDTVGDHAMEARPLDGHTANLAKRAQLDMSSWWAPTAASYFDQVPKAHALAVVGKVVSSAAASPLAGLKKGEISSQAERLLEGKGWLPELLRRPE